MSSTIEITTVSNPAQLHQIIALQKQNLVTLISDTEKKEQGFLTVEHSLEELVQMNEIHPQVIAISDNQVVGFAMVMMKESAKLVPQLVPFFELLTTIAYRGKPLEEFNYYVMGQICIAKEYRNKGVFKRLYAKHREELSNRYDFCITEVAVDNLRSMAAHEAVGFKKQTSYFDGAVHWNVMVWDWK